MPKQMSQLKTVCQWIKLQLRSNCKANVPPSLPSHPSRLRSHVPPLYSLAIFPRPPALPAIICFNSVCFQVILIDCLQLPPMLYLNINGMAAALCSIQPLRFQFRPIFRLAFFRTFKKKAAKKKTKYSQSVDVI